MFRLSNKIYLVNLIGTYNNVKTASLELKKIYELNNYLVKITDIKILNINEFNIYRNKNIIINKLENTNLDKYELNMLLQKSNIIPIIYKIDSNIKNIEDLYLLKKDSYNNIDAIYPLQFEFNDKYKIFGLI